MTHPLIASLLLCTALAAHAQNAPQKPPRKPVPRAIAATAPAPPPATSEQLIAAALAHLGAYACELGQSLELRPSPRHEGYVELLLGKQQHTLKPVLSSTGALRLEDVSGRLLLVQIAMKSMLLDVKSGRRLADDCVHAQQAENRRTATALPAEPGLSIDPDRAAAVAAAASAAASTPASAAAPASSASAAAPASAASAASAASTGAGDSAVNASAPPASAPAAGPGPATPLAPVAKP